MDVLRRLRTYVRPYWKALAGVSILLLLRTGLNRRPPLVQREVGDQVIADWDLSLLRLLIAPLIGVHAFSQATSFGDMFLRQAIGERFIFELRVAIYDHLQQLSLSFYENTSTGELMSRVTNEVTTLENFVTHGVALRVADLLRLAGASAVLMVLNWRLALVTLIRLPLIGGGVGVFSPRRRGSTAGCGAGAISGDSRCRRAAVRSTDVDSGDFVLMGPLPI